MDYKTQHTHRKTETLHIGIPHELYLDLSRIAFEKDLPTSAVGRLAVSAFVSAITGKKYTMNTLGGFRMPSLIAASVVAEAAGNYASRQNSNISAVLAAADSASFASAEDAVANLSRNFAGISPATPPTPTIPQTDDIVAALLPKILAALRAAGISAPSPSPSPDIAASPSPDIAASPSPADAASPSPADAASPSPADDSPSPHHRRGRPRKLFADSPASLPPKNPNSNPAS